jgi:hypothetical protein
MSTQDILCQAKKSQRNLLYADSNPTLQTGNHCYKHNQSQHAYNNVESEIPVPVFRLLNDTVSGSNYTASDGMIY